MKVKDLRSNGTTMFYALNIGDVFKYSENYFIKVEKHNYFNLSLCSFGPTSCSDFSCTKLNASIVIED